MGVCEREREFVCISTVSGAVVYQLVCMSVHVSVWCMCVFTSVHSVVL